MTSHRRPDMPVARADELDARPADTAEARLREAAWFTDAQLAEEIHKVTGCQVGSIRTANIIKWFRGKIAALSPPSGGDEAKESEGGVEGHAAEKRRSSTPEPEQARDEINEEGAAGIKPGPSEPSPPADRREIVAWFKDRIDKYATQLNATGQADVAHLLRRDAQIILAALDGGRDA